MRRYPYQCIEICQPDGQNGLHYLLAACGHRIISISLSSGDEVSRWPQEQVRIKAKEEQSVEQPVEPPTKKQKLIDEGRPANVSRLAVALDQKRVVAITAEDKCIRVFYIDTAGRLEQLSQRSMPKRPCAIAFSSDGATIFSGDKFGDVYALPLLPTSDEPLPQEEKTTVVESKKFVPSATTLTVHTGRNRKALEAQLKDADKHVKTDKSLKFAHELLLGHVSMLTDVVSTQVVIDNRPRNYILTADRDEHIRVSRGPPQSHVIETYCLGHEQFVNRLCLATPSILVSGGGDDDLFVWDWLKGSLLKRLNLSAIVTSYLSTSSEAGNQTKPVAVSGIWAVERGAKQVHLLVALEGISALLHFAPDLSSKDITWNQGVPISLAGNILDAACFDDCFIVAIDTAHAPNITAVLRESKDVVPGFQALRFEDSQLVSHATLDAILTKVPVGHEIDTQGEKGLRDLLYGIENLRKRGGEE